jgi:hypothetical protein
MASLQEALEGFTPLGKGLAAAMAATYLLQLAAGPAVLGALGLVPGRAVPCLWMVVTGALVQDSLPKVRA